jgi:hypothetical protein
MALTLADLFTSPDHYLHSFDGAQAVFVPMDRAAYARSIFLDARIEPAGGGAMRLPTATLAGYRPEPRPAAWIFHVAHCGSTLLARALDRPAGGLVLREPLALRQAALARDPAALAIAAAMCGKRYADAPPTIVKANVPVNFVLPELGQRQPGAAAIVLYLGLRDYALAILRSDKHRQWLRNVTGQLAGALGEASGGSDDAETLAALWLAQVRAFAGALDAWPAARALDAERFFAAPAPVLRAAAAHLGQPMAADEAAAIAAGPLFGRYSKNPALPFDEAARQARRADADARLAPEIARAEAWIAERAEAAAALARLEAAALA